MVLFVEEPNSQVLVILLNSHSVGVGDVDDAAGGGAEERADDALLGVAGHAVLGTSGCTTTFSSVRPESFTTSISLPLSPRRRTRLEIAMPEKAERGSGDAAVVDRQIDTTGEHGGAHLCGIPASTLPTLPSAYFSTSSTFTIARTTPTSLPAVAFSRATPPTT